LAHRILVVDDDPHIRDVLVFALSKAGMVVDAARDGMAALDAIGRRRPDLIILDVGMPEMDGLEVCRRIRRTSSVPILFLSARDEEVDRVLGLEMGGDDYVTKPFSPREVVARVNVILRRAAAADDATASAPLACGSLRLDRGAHRADFAGAPVALSAIEFAILATLLARPGMLFSRDRLMTAAYGPRIHVAERTIDSHVRNIRRKLAESGCDSAIETVHGVGFRLGRCEPRA
jgi:two-component system OmpR family response regulator